MATFNVSVTSTATAILTGQAQYGSETVTILNPSLAQGGAGITVYVGAGSGVTTTTGWALTPGSSIVCVNPPAAAAYGITAASAATLTITQNIS